MYTNNCGEYDIVNNKVCPSCLGEKKVLLVESQCTGTKLYEICKNCVGTGFIDNADVLHLSESVVSQSQASNRLID
jgi:hypothetical protein